MKVKQRKERYVDRLVVCNLLFQLLMLFIRQGLKIDLDKYLEKPVAGAVPGGGHRPVLAGFPNMAVQHHYLILLLLLVNCLIIPLLSR